MGRAMARTEDGRRGMKCTQLSAPGIPCGPVSGVSEGWGGVRKEWMERRWGWSQGPHLHLKLSNEIYNRMRLFAVKRGIQLFLLWAQTDTVGRETAKAAGRCDLMTWGVEEVQLDNRKWCKRRLRETEWKDVAATKTILLSNPHLKYGQICLRQIEDRCFWSGDRVDMRFKYSSSRRGSVLCIWVKHSPRADTCQASILKM